MGNQPIFLTDIIRQHLYDFVGYLRKEGPGDRTVHNRCGEVITFLRHFGFKEVTIKVKFTELKVRAYRPDELQAMFTVPSLGGLAPLFGLKKSQTLAAK